MWLGSPQQLEKVNVSETARDLSVIVDSQLTLSAQVFAVCCSGYYQLRQLRPLVRSMSSDAVKTLVQAFISCHLDYCNSMFYGITNGLMSRLWSVQNEELHWLRVRRRVDFKMVTLVYLALSGMAPAYLAADCQLVSDEGRRQLSSDGPTAAMETDTLLLQVRGCGTNFQPI